MERHTISGFTTSGTTETKTLITATADTLILSMIFSNSELADAEISVVHKDNTDAEIFKYALGLAVTGSPIALDSKVLLKSGDKVEITSNKDNVAIFATAVEV